MSDKKTVFETLSLWAYNRAQTDNGDVFVNVREIEEVLEHIAELETKIERLKGDQWISESSPPAFTDVRVKLSNGDDEIITTGKYVHIGWTKPKNFKTPKGFLVIAWQPITPPQTTGEGE